MIAKELIDARWKVLVGVVVALVGAIFSAYAYEILKQALGGMSLSGLPQSIQDELNLASGGYDSSTWASWFRSTGVELLAVLAAFMGGSLIAGEVSKGTIFFLLSKPVSRERVLLTKYVVSAVLLLDIALLGAIALLLTAALLGHPQSVVGVALSTLLLWLGMLFVLGLALLFSVLFDDLLRPIGLAVLVTAVLGLPGYFPDLQDLNLTGYWTNFAAYQGVAFPGKEIIVTLVFAALPLAAALLLFKRRAF